MTDSAGPGPQPATGWPRCGASAAVFRGRDVLLVQRGKGAYRGRWSLPGGHIEPGERAKAAAAREVREETGVEARIGGLVDIHEVVLRSETGALTAHYLIAVFVGRWLAGEPVPGADELAAQFVPLDAVPRETLTGGAADLIERAWAILQNGLD